MPEYLTPGVYVEEVPSGPRPIQGVGTATVGRVLVGVAIGIVAALILKRAAALRP